MKKDAAVSTFSKIAYKRFCIVLAAGFLNFAVNAQVDFGAYYTKINQGQDWETYSRTGDHADVVVKLAARGGEVVFWRGNSYLPYWKSGKGLWDFPAVIQRTGNGNTRMPDRANVYSYVKIIENNIGRVIVQWGYLAKFGEGNPHAGVDPDNFAEETFTILRSGLVKREIKTGTQKIDDWNDTAYKTTQVLQLTSTGIEQVGLTNPTRSYKQVSVKVTPKKSADGIRPSLWISFDEGMGDSVTERFQMAKTYVPGNKTIWKKGVSGAALDFDGYNTGLIRPSDNDAELPGRGSITLNGWLALGAYPWNWAPLVQQGDTDGYFLGVDSHGYPGFMLKTDTGWEQLTVPNEPPYKDSNHLRLFRWYDLSGTYDIEKGIARLYLDGKQVASKSVGKNSRTTHPSKTYIGKASIATTPTDGTHDTYPSVFGIDGLIDEVQVYRAALTSKQIAQNYQKFFPGKSEVLSPDLQRRAFPKPSTNRQFKGMYTHLPYHETWENMFRFGKYADVVVGFDQLPIKYVFWRGVSYIPMIVNESGQWFTNQFDETGFTKEAPGDCEPMSDKGCWDSQVRIIENSPARVVVNWRYRQADPSHHWGNYDSTTGWGDISDWDYYIYPDGVSSKVMRWYSAKPEEWHEWDEQIAVLGEGQHPEKVLRKAPVMTLVDSSGRSVDYNWNPNPPKPNWKGTVIQKINYTGKYSPYSIQKFTDGDIYDGERTWYAVFPSWNHWPTAQINSSGRNASFPDRASHSSISHLYWALYQEQNGNAAFQEKVLLEGMTDQPAAALSVLARSWLDAPYVSNVSGGISRGYNQGRRAYCFEQDSSLLKFQIEASDAHPVHNLCFEVRKWNSSIANADVRVNGLSKTAGTQLRQGTIIDTDGTYSLIIWMKMDASVTQRFEIAKPK